MIGPHAFARAFKTPRQNSGRFAFFARRARPRAADTRYRLTTRPVKLTKAQASPTIKHALQRQMFERSTCTDIAGIDGIRARPRVAGFARVGAPQVAARSCHRI